MSKTFKILFLLFVCLFGMNLVSAKSVDKIDTNYYFERKKGNIDFSDKMHIYKIDGALAYCIEPGVKIGNDYKESSFNDVNLNKTQKDNITKLAYFGARRYKETGNMSYYIAAQSLIWKEVMGYDTSIIFSSNLFGKGNITDFSLMEREVLNGIKDYDKKPSIIGTHDISVGDETTLIDNNKVLSEYEVVSDDGLNAKIESNSLKFRLDDFDTKTIKLRRKRYFDNIYVIYHDVNYQDMIAAGNFDVDEYTIKIKPIMTYLEVLKKDESDKPLEGIIFGIYDKDNKLIEKIKTDKNGYAKTTPLKMGKYSVRELKTKSGYEIDNKNYEFDIRKETVKMEFKNHKKPVESESKESIESKESKESIESESTYEKLPENPKTGDEGIPVFLISLLSELGLSMGLIGIHRKRC